MYVLKFGGSSVANAENIRKVAAIVQSSDAKQVVVVVSALGGMTNELLTLGTKAAEGDENYKGHLDDLRERHLNVVKSLLPITGQSSSLSLVMQLFNELEDIAESIFRLREFSPATKDRILAFGETLSSKIIAAYFASLNLSHRWLDAKNVILTNSKFSNAKVHLEPTMEIISKTIQNFNEKIILVPGFIASNKKGQTTTLGRGGSDYTAALFAAALNATRLEIWTDVSGMMTADPRWVSGARIIQHITFKEAMELSHFGAKVIYPPTIIPAMNAGIPILIKNTFDPEAPGTLIDNEPTTHELEQEIVTGISSMTEIALLSIEGSGMVGVPGTSKTLFETLAAAQINVILITQSSSEHSICVAVDAADIELAKEALDSSFNNEITTGKIEPIKIERGLSIVALVGDKMKSHPGISGKMFSVLGRNGINVRAIAQGSSEKNISAVIAFEDVKKAINVLHEAFFEKVYKQLNLFIVGVGNVGSRLLAQLKQQKSYLQHNLNIQLRIAGLANSRKMVFSDNGGVSLDHWEQALQEGQQFELSAFINTVIEKNVRNAVVVDVTANAAIAGTYKKFLEKSVAVVACNKIACSSSYEDYQQLKSLSKAFNAPFFFETNVGAGLPVIGTLNDLLRSGDEVVKIQAVLSGTLNFVFNNYDTTKTFEQVVAMAQQEGYTEPDPRLDLGGTDVMRKILILARESGHALNMEDIQNTPFLPASCFEGSVEDFYGQLKVHEDHFKKLYEAAANEGCKLKYVASFEQGKASVGLQAVSAQSDFFHLYGKDNIVLFYTKRYPDQPLVIKGAGAGADVTASGVFADLIKTVY
ncbi:bifunctional aspartate kinase/homoserine dehydrogenase I [Arachidicoccus ginsenosidivorans]|jgi:aspartokinase/homoserine dehydrogenase 1|uniref:Bifunctional aspartate kinase/homoserine dehydrogenase I n=1 Tax=Arachidicoccus ginsenosidivorans TaxID=496057 RepID=A0A5B8VJN9_9BACT|nr:bifunctional aspartate kinase/homoserine dehydrogenase I [Arachidicoccus ginsenosidivorans]QEC71172.1 bifunctional aspartate kinase/homoserine dehydrogenase I [Arachidicoccus ginsenosidivorans]